MLAVTVVCGDDDEQAERMAAPIRLAVVKQDADAARRSQVSQEEASVSASAAECRRLPTSS